MPRAKGKSTNTPQPTDGVPFSSKLRYACPDDAKWGGFLNYRMTEDDADNFQEWFNKVQSEAGWVLLDEILKQGMKLSVTHDTGNNTFIATFTGDLLDVGDRRAVTSRAPFWAQAILLAVYKHVVVLGGDYSSLVTAQPTWNVFG